MLYCITRPDNPWGWNLEDFFEEFGGVPVKGKKKWKWPDGKEAVMVSNLGRSDLSWIYNFARSRGVLLQDSGSEGLCLPILEAMWVGTPVVGMDHTAITELLQDGRGFLFPTGYAYRDIFGNNRRYHPNYDTWAAVMTQAYENPDQRLAVAKTAQAWVEKRAWDAAAQVVLGEIE